MSNNSNFSVIYFSVFTPEILESKVKNNFMKNRPKRNFINFKTQNNILINKVKAYSSTNLKPFFCKTTSNIQKKHQTKKDVLLFRDFITLQSNKSKKKKNSKKSFGGIGRAGSVEPYKQYIIEKRELEENKKRREIEKKYIIESRKLHDIRLINDIKTKYDGYDFSRQESESKNYSKEKTKYFYGRSSAINTRKNNYQYIDIDLLEDIKSNKRKNIFEEDFDLKSSTKYNSFRLKAVSFIKSLRHNPNYNYWIRKDH